jgi:hypothetical protein
MSLKAWGWREASEITHGHFKFEFLRTLKHEKISK